jgi:hypothetical protein
MELGSSRLAGKFDKSLIRIALFCRMKMRRGAVLAFPAGHANRCRSQLRMNLDVERKRDRATSLPLNSIEPP